MDNPIGQKIREYRESKNIQISELNERSQLSVELIQKIENDEISPNLYYLTKIARALGTRIGAFLDDSNECSCIITRSDKSDSVTRYVDGAEKATEKMIFKSLGRNKKDRNMEPFVISLLPQTQTEKKQLSSHEGEEFIYVLSGKIGVQYGKNYYELDKGDSLYFDSAVPHNVHSIEEDGGSLILAVLYIP